MDQDEPIFEEKASWALTISRVIMFLVVIGGIAWLINANIPFDGKKHYDRRVDQASPFVGYFHPSARVTSPETVDGKIVQRMLEEPLYFETRTFMRYDKGHIALVVKKELPETPAIGVKLEGENVQMLDTSATDLGNGWYRLEADAPLRNAAWLDGWYHFVISCPGLKRDTKDSGSIAVSEVEVGLSRPPLSFSDLADVWKRFIQ